MAQNPLHTSACFGSGVALRLRILAHQPPQILGALTVTPAVVTFGVASLAEGRIHADFPYAEEPSRNVAPIPLALAPST
jgi:hypothetical protein